MDLTNIILAVISVLGFVIAIYQTYIAIVQIKKTKRLEKQRELTLWTQIASMKAMMRHLERKDVHQAYGLVCEQFRSLLKDAAFEEKRYNLSTIKLWRRVGKLSSDWQERQALMLLSTSDIETATKSEELKEQIPVSPSTYDETPDDHEVAKLRPGTLPSSNEQMTTFVSEEKFFKPNSVNRKYKILFIAENSEICKRAGKLVKEQFSDVEVIYWTRGDSKPSNIDTWEGDFIISFKSDLILDSSIIKKASLASINFHPAPPEYRGIGGHVYAIYNKDIKFGITCHFMNENIDDGMIISVKRFRVLRNEKASELKRRADEMCYIMLVNLINDLQQGKHFSVDENEQWGNKLYTRKELERFIKELTVRDPSNECLK